MSDRGRRPAAGTPERRGLFDSFLAPRPAVETPMPSIRTSFARGSVTAISTPLLLIGVPVVVVLEWAALVALGFQGPFAILVNALALPPVGTLTDVTVTGNVFGGAGLGFVAVGVAVIVRGALFAVIAAAAVQALRDGRVNRWVWAPAVRALPASLAVSFASLSLLFAQILLSSIVGGAIGGFGLLILFGGLVLGVSWFGFAPAIGASEQRRLGDTLSRSYRAARIPGAGNLTLAVLYVIPSYAILVAPGKPGGLIGVNPSVGAWVLVLLVNVLHVAVAVTYAYRYLSIADTVPEAPARPAPRGR